jgi:hypothetical protein
MNYFEPDAAAGGKIGKPSDRTHFAPMILPWRLLPEES